ncbi:MAG: NAD(+) kinase [Legionellaceae bacterium]|nr:NAD(+) kinase [Legionellaceae bacterium]
MNTQFKTIGIIGRLSKQGMTEALQALIACLQAHKLDIVLEKETAQSLGQPQHNLVNRQALGEQTDLIITVGGDGNLLSAARIAAPNNIPILGINRGKFGFLTDIRPDEINQQVPEILSGNYHEEKRFMLNATVEGQKKALLGLNDIIVTPDNTSRMIEFEITVDNNFMCSQRSDGMIIATPTGSTAYALSAGGPILHPDLNSIVMVPMFPHSLNNRPIVISGDSEISICIPENRTTAARATADGQNDLPLAIGSKLTIKKNNQSLRLLHPKDYNYFETLRGKLHWGHKIYAED